MLPSVAAPRYRNRLGSQAPLPANSYRASRENAAEAAVVESVDVYGACSLSQVVHFLRGYIALEPVHSLNCWPETESAEQDLDFGEIKGQQHVKRRRSRRPAGTTF